jgi:CheY-like chemotaxis protein
VTVSYTIFIVDDNPDEVLLTEMVLAEIDAGIHVESASRGEQALELLNAATKAPSLILLDMKLPGMCGLETLQAIRSSDRLKHIPVVIFTSSSLASDEQAAYAGGANAFLHKGIDLSRFNEELRSLLHQLVKKK